MLAKSPQRHDIALGHVKAARVGLFIADGESPLGEAFGKLFDALIFKIMIYMPDEYYKTSAAANVAAAADMYRQVEELGQKTWVESMAKVGVHRCKVKAETLEMSERLRTKVKDFAYCSRGT